MYDVRLIKRAKFYAEAMSQGIDPVTGEFASENDTISHERIQQCMGYIVSLLDDVLKYGLGGDKAEFCITPAQKSKVRLSDNEIGVNDLAKRINNEIDTGFVKGVTGSKIASWLVSRGYLSEQVYGEMKSSKRTVKTLNEKSALLGLKVIDKTRHTGEVYKQIVYPPSAQRFVLDNIEEIAKFMN